MNQQEILDKAVVGLFLGKHSGFLSTMYCGLKFSWDETIPTACTNGLFLKINPTWFAGLTERSRVSLLAHELWHVAYMHMARAGDRDRAIWNWACDHAINLQMIKDGFHFDMPYLGDPRFAGMSAEEIYDIAIDEANKVDLPFGEDFEVDPDPEKKEEIEREVTNLIIRAKTVNDMCHAGKLPGELESMIEALLRPRMPWTVLLQRWCTEISSLVSTWRRPNRRYTDLYLPSRGGQEGLAHLLFGIDASGSMTDAELQVINSELASIKEIHNPQSMEVVSFDTVIQDTWEFQAGDELKQLTIHGRGGTDMEPLFELARKKRPSALVVFSDMWCRMPDPIPGVPVLWIAIDNPEFSAPFGHAIHLDTSNYSQA